MQKAHNVHFIKSELFWKNLQLAFQGLLERNQPLPAPHPPKSLLPLKNGHFPAWGFVEGKALDLGSDR